MGPSYHVHSNDILEERLSMFLIEKRSQFSFESKTKYHLLKNQSRELIFRRRSHPYIATHVLYVDRLHFLLIRTLNDIRHCTIQDICLCTLNVVTMEKYESL